MTEKELKKLTRAELLELLLIQTREVENLRKKLVSMEDAMNDRNLRILEAGDLAHAVLQVNDVMQAAQAAAQQYLDNIKIMEEQTRVQCEQLLEAARQEAAQIREMAQRSPASEAEA